LIGGRWKSGGKILIEGKYGRKEENPNLKEE